MPQPENAASAACDHDWVISSVVPDTRVCVRCNATEPTPEPTPILVAPDAAPVDYDGPNKWLNGVKARVEDTGDGYVRLPRSDWEGVVHGFEWGEVLFGDATDALRRILHFPYDVGHTPERDLREMREIASAGLVAVGLKEPEEDETDG